jgi:DNA-binding response OmpR family regulator
VPQKILLVDDDENILFLFGLALEEHGYTVHTAVTGAEALVLVKAIEFDVILLDYKLTDIDGLVVAEEIQKIREKAEIIMVTGTQDLQLPHALVKIVSKVILKPVSEEELVNEIQTVLNYNSATEAV